jgi:hypothetical protein
VKNLLTLTWLLLLATLATAHVGSPDVYFEGDAGPYRMLVVVRMPAVVPGVAEIEIHALSPGLQNVKVVPLRIIGLGAELAPVADPAERSSEDRGVFRAKLWVMLRGAWKIQIEAEGDRGTGELAVPIAAVALTARPMSGNMAWLLISLMATLVLGAIGIVGAAVRESMSPPGVDLPPSASRHARIAMVCAAILVAGLVWLGKAWWSSEAATNAETLYTVPHVSASLDSPSQLSLSLGKPSGRRWSERIRLDDLVPDHGHLMHLFLVRLPGLDRMYHLHPRQEGMMGHFVQQLPAMSSGQYQVFADIVHATGFPETEVSEIALPNVPGAALQGDDAAAVANPLTMAGRSMSSTLSSGASVRWMRDTAPLRAGELAALRFRVEDAAGRAVTDLEPYMGMAGHMVVVRSDCKVFAHVHPNGSAPMATVELANGVSSGTTSTVHPAHAAAIPAEIAFPYGFPQAGTYRLFVQIKRAGQIETAVFDAEVAESAAR